MAADQTKCANNPYVRGSAPWNDFVQYYQCWVYDPSIDAPSIFASEYEPTSTRSSSVAYEDALPASSVDSGKPSKTVIKGLQNAINRFYGVALGSPIVVDGLLGNDTLSAVNSIIAWMPSRGYDTSTIYGIIGTNPTVASISLKTAALSNLIDWLAEDNGFTVGETPDPPSVPAVQTARGKVPAFTPTIGESQLAAAGLFGLGLPNWAVYAGGAALALALAMLIKRKRGW